MPNETKNEESKPAGLTEEQVTDLVNKAISGRLKGFETSITKLIGEQITSGVQGLMKQREEEEAQKKASDKEPEWKRELDKVNKALATEKAAREAAEKAVTEERESRMADERRSTLGAELRKRGVPDALIKPAIAYLHDVGKHVVHGEDGKTIVARTKGKTGELEDAPLGKWLDDSFFKSDEGKAFLPAKGAGGSGNRPARQGSGGAGANGAGGAAEAREEARSTLFNAIMGGGGDG